VWREESRGGGPDELFERCVAHGEEGGGRAGAWGMVDAAHVGCRVQDDGTVARAGGFPAPPSTLSAEPLGREDEVLVSVIAAPA